MVAREGEGSKVEYVKILAALEEGRSYEVRKIQQFPARVALSLREVVAAIEDAVDQSHSGQFVIRNFFETN